MSIEQFIYHQVKRFPWLKDSLRTIYQWSSLPWLGAKVECARKITLHPGYFFGFHDKSPWSWNGSLVLAHRIDGPFDPGRSEAAVGYFENGGKGDFHSIGKTLAWSKQQGAQLQWCGKENLIIYNVLDAQNNAGSRLVTAEGYLIQEYEFPIGAVDAAGEFAFVVDYHTFGSCMQGYGYGSAGFPINSQATGLTEIKLGSGNTLVHASLDDICAIAGWEKSNEYQCFISHPQYSPENTQVAFFVRRHRPGLRIETRMCVLNRSSGKVRAISRSTMASHFCWLDDVNVLVYLESEAGKDEFRIINTLSGESSAPVGLPSSDGHPNFSTASHSVVLDAYPDRRRRQKLGVYRYQGKANFSTTETMSFYSPLKFRNEDRVDLHPRWDRSGRNICVDCSYRGDRSMAILHGKSNNSVEN